MSIRRVVRNDLVRHVKRAPSIFCPKRSSPASPPLSHALHKGACFRAPPLAFWPPIASGDRRIAGGGAKLLDPLGGSQQLAATAHGDATEEDGAGTRKGLVERKARYGWSFPGPGWTRILWRGFEGERAVWSVWVGKWWRWAHAVPNSTQRQTEG